MKEEPLSEGLKRALQALDHQVSRDVNTRGPEEVAEKHFEKWEAIDERIERVSSEVLQWVGENEIRLDSMLIMSQALVKALSLAVMELEREGLGKTQTAYCVAAFESMTEDVRRALATLHDEATLM